MRLMANRRSATIMAAAVASVLLTVSTQGAWATGRPAASAAAPPRALAPAVVGQDTWHDFDDDGFDDLVIADPREDVGSVKDAGAVHVIYASDEEGLTDRDQVWTQDSAPNGQPAVPDKAEAGDHFGAAVAVGDFNGDNYGDLAIGVPNEEKESQHPLVLNAGGIQLLWGSATGLRTSIGAGPSQFLTVPSEPEHGQGPHLGAALAALDAYPEGATDTYADLAFGVPGLDLSPMMATAGRWNGPRGMDPPLVDAGLAAIVAGAADGFPDGLGPDSQLVALVCGELTAGDRCGTALAAGDFDGVADDDLAIGAPFHDFTAAADAGSVWVKYQPFNDAVAPHTYNQGGGARGDRKEAGDHYGSVLAAGNLMDSPEHDELVVGTPLEDVTVGSSTRADAGVVQIWLGTAAGLFPTVATLISQDSVDGPFALADTVEAGDKFGAALAVAGYGKTNELDLAIGVPGEDLNGKTDVGAVAVLYGGADGVTIDGSQFLRQGQGGVAGTQTAGDRFGSALAGLELGHNTYEDLVIGVPFEDITRSGTTFQDAGAIQALFGTLTGLGTADQQTLTEDSPGIADQAETADRFGGVLR